MDMNKNNETKEVSTETEFNKLNIDNIDNIDKKNCSYCDKPFNEKLWCKECDPRHIIEGWTSGNNDIDKFIKDTIYDARKFNFNSFVEWIPFDRFENVEQIGDEYSKIYSATWNDGQAIYTIQDDGSWRKLDPKPMKVALKRLNGSETITDENLNEIKMHWELYSRNNSFLEFYGISKDPETKEFFVVIQFANQRNLRYVLSNHFSTISWKEKINYLYGLAIDLKNLHEFGYYHKNVHSGNILQDDGDSYLSNFEYSEPSNKQESDNKICGVLSYIAPEVLIGESYTLSSDIYSFGVIMAEISSGKPPFYKRRHDANLASEICNGIRPEFGRGTPEVYKKLAYKCMNANSNQRPTANELHELLYFWRDSINFYDKKYPVVEKFGYKEKEINSIFKQANSVKLTNTNAYEKVPDVLYNSRVFTFNNLPKPINSSIIITYLNDDENKD
ncbi:unnamed protein product [Rhizophagus irregularis]|nr:unnamed protein product [Rhizophagus irregularis]